VTLLLRTIVAALLMSAIAMSGSGVAGAHTVLVSSDPAADATVPNGPPRVSATFNEDLQPAFAAMTVVGPDGNLWSSGEPEVRGPVASVAVRTLGPPGRYTVNYRVTSADGHVVSGSWSFTVTAAGTGVPGPSVAAEPAERRVPLWPFVIGVGVMVGAAAVWALRRRS
jgi:methionine-rich copper-binding protein CopC